MFLLDTNIVSELKKLRPHGGLLSWYMAQQREQLSLPSVVLFEMQAGAEKTRRQDKEKAQEIDRWISALPEQLRIIPFGEGEARVTALFLERRKPDLLPDAMIAATAAVHGLTVVTRNTSDFQQFPVPILNPFKS